MPNKQKKNIFYLILRICLTYKFVIPDIKRKQNNFLAELDSAQSFWSRSALVWTSKQWRNSPLFTLQNSGDGNKEKRRRRRRRKEADLVTLLVVLVAHGGVVWRQTVVPGVATKQAGGRR